MTAAPQVVRVPRAWGEGGDPMCEAASMDIGLKTAAVVDAGELDEQHLMIADALSERPVVLGGCCCTHVGAARGLARRHGRIAVVWFDAHGDLNTPATSPSGNLWGMPFRMLLDGGDIAVEDAALIGARNLDPPEDDFIDATGLATTPGELDGVLDGVVGAYIALDCDVLDPSEIACFMPEPDGPSVEDVFGMIERVAGRVPVVGIGLTGLVNDPANPPRLRRFCAAAGVIL